MARWTHYGARLFAFLAVIGLPLSVIGIWARDTVLDKTMFVQTFTPVWNEPAVQTAVADRVMLEVRNQLPEMGRVTDRALERAVNDLVGSSAFKSLWIEVLGLAHRGVVAVWLGESQSGLVTAGNDYLSIDLAPVLLAANEQLLIERIPLFTTDTLPEHIQLDVVSVDQLESAQRVLVWLDRLGIWLPVLSALMAILALGLSDRRWRMLFWMGVSAAFLLELVMLALVVVQGRLVDQPRDGVTGAFVSVLLDEGFRRFWLMSGISVMVTATLAFAAGMVMKKQITASS